MDRKANDGLPNFPKAYGSDFVEEVERCVEEHELYFGQEGEVVVHGEVAEGVANSASEGLGLRNERCYLVC